MSIFKKYVISEQLYYFDASGNANFPGALNYRESDLIFQVFPIRSFRYEGVDSEGYYEVGRTIGEVSYSITAIGGSPNDTLRFPGNNIVFEGRLNSVKFPLNYEDEWIESRIERTPFELTVQAFGLNKMPGERQRTLTHQRRVAGHGKLILPKPDGSPTAEMDVLMIRVVRHSIDSIFLVALLPRPL
jgi:hypothetical protein